jgi:plastocyanin
LFAGLAVIAPLAMTGSALADSSGLEVSHETVKICEAAEIRYRNLYHGAEGSEGHVVLLYKYTYCPATLTIRTGATVRWVNVDKRTSHSVWLKDAGISESERFFPEEQWEYTFTTVGRYPYLCGPHWESDAMKGILTVVE